MSTQSSRPTARRSFLTRLNVGAASIAALTLGGIARAQVKPGTTVRWEPTRHAQDDWMDALPGKHRLVIDTTTLDGIRDGLLFAGNFILANRTDYGLKNEDVAVIVVARHFSTHFALNNDMWTKYGAPLNEAPTGGTPPKEPLKANPNASSLASLAGQGVHFAVCSMAMNRVAGIIAKSTGGKAETIFAELNANLVANSHPVAAGIVALNRAQERGYSFVSA